MSQISITAFYKFLTLTKAQVQNLQEELHEFGETNDMRGLIILAEEGINGTVSGTSKTIPTFQKVLQSHFGETLFKNSTSVSEPFRRWFVKIRPEIVSIGNAQAIPTVRHRSLSPQEWQHILDTEEVVVLDARNTYETRIGKFKHAIDPQIRKFQEFPQFVQHCTVSKEKKILLYCTGGIRCEKALMTMEEHGYKNVFQLEGGILKYLEQFPCKNFEGECFVFDHRTAVDQELRPSKMYALCPHCGDPGDRIISCVLCKNTCRVCRDCLHYPQKHTCSKNCAHHYSRQLSPAAAAPGAPC
ncbi:hypothetical protein A2635_02465 [Candidatus Peribacteria bacterium RIFCSPHIGHO2_01_FULL_51_9]|nr:MAG: hypothetical protein A2635_02465 [Candidatus Peribacteria bacterium RIFCSPHIGHO2_01_FULL_51_9]